MLYVLWGFLNLLTFVGVLFLFVKAITSIRERIGMAAAMIFVFVAFSFARASPDRDNKDSESNNVKMWGIGSRDSLEEGSNSIVEIVLENTSISKYCLNIHCAKDKAKQKSVAVSAKTFVTGFQSGTTWKPLSIIINSTNENDRLEYIVHGTVKWNLLGITFYSQSKEWQGYVKIK